MVIFNSNVSLPEGTVRNAIHSGGMATGNAPALHGSTSATRWRPKICVRESLALDSLYISVWSTKALGLQWFAIISFLDMDYIEVNERVLLFLDVFSSLWTRKFVDLSVFLVLKPPFRTFFSLYYSTCISNHPICVFLAFFNIEVINQYSTHIQAIERDRIIRSSQESWSLQVRGAWMLSAAWRGWRCWRGLKTGSDPRKTWAKTTDPSKLARELLSGRRKIWSCPKWWVLRTELEVIQRKRGGWSTNIGLIKKWVRATAVIFGIWG